MILRSKKAKFNRTYSLTTGIFSPFNGFVVFKRGDEVFGIEVCANATFPIIADSVLWASVYELEEITYIEEDGEKINYTRKTPREWHKSDGYIQFLYSGE